MNGSSYFYRNHALPLFQTLRATIRPIGVFSLEYILGCCRRPSKKKKSSYNSVHPYGPEARVDEAKYKFSIISMNIQVQHNCNFYFTHYFTKICIRVRLFGILTTNQLVILRFYLMRPINIVILYILICIPFLYDKN